MYYCLMGYNNSITAITSLTLLCSCRLLVVTIVLIIATCLLRQAVAGVPSLRDYRNRILIT